RSRPGACDADERRSRGTRDRDTLSGRRRRARRRRRIRRLRGHRCARRVCHRAGARRRRGAVARAPRSLARLTLSRADVRRWPPGGGGGARWNAGRTRLGVGVVSLQGAATVAGVECAKLSRQIKVQAALAACAAGPFAFAAAVRVQSSMPEDTLFGRAVKESGFALPLVVLGFAALWVFPVLTSVVGGDVFSAEDRFGTWKTVLTRSRSR